MYTANRNINVKYATFYTYDGYIPENIKIFFPRRFFISSAKMRKALPDAMAGKSSKRDII